MEYKYSRSRSSTTLWRHAISVTEVNKTLNMKAQECSRYMLQIPKPLAAMWAHRPRYPVQAAPPRIATILRKPRRFPGSRWSWAHLAVRVLRDESCSSFMVFCRMNFPPWSLGIAVWSLEKFFKLGFENRDHCNNHRISPNAFKNEVCGAEGSQMLEASQRSLDVLLPCFE